MHITTIKSLKGNLLKEQRLFNQKKRKTRGQKIEEVKSINEESVHGKKNPKKHNLFL